MQGLVGKKRSAGLAWWLVAIIVAAPTALLAAAALWFILRARRRKAAGRKRADAGADRRLLAPAGAASKLVDDDNDDDGDDADHVAAQNERFRLGADEADAAGEEGLALGEVVLSGLAASPSRHALPLKPAPPIGLNARVLHSDNDLPARPPAPAGVVWRT